MSAIYIVLPLALIFVAVAVLVFLRLVHSGQLDDLDTPGVRMLHDDTASCAEREPQDRRGSGSKRRA